MRAPILLRLAAAVATLCPPPVLAAQQPAPPIAVSPATIPVTVTVANGPLVGRNANGVRVFKNIPYAAPPVGDRRWRAPQPVANWSAPRDAGEFGPICWQTDRLTKVYGGTLEPTSEDCLSLNIWTAADLGRAGDRPVRRPVMVWIHGGSFTHGSGRSAIYDGTQFATAGIVLVTINYRLGGFGFFSHPALSAESPTRTSGNQGLQDQAAALRWVRDNITAFGGDPNNVTIFGESAGAFSVADLLASPVARGLFHKAILQSGSSLRQLPPLRGANDSARSAERSGVAIARASGVDAAAAAGDEGLRRLRALPPDSLLALHAAQPGAPTDIVDGAFLTEPPGVTIARGRHARVPILIGTNADEATILVRPVPVTTAEQFEALVRRLYGPQAEPLLALYPTTGTDGARRAYRQLWTDDVFAAPARETARAFARSGQRVYRYYYTRVADGMTGLALGAFHASEIPFVFGITQQASPLWGKTSSDATLALAMNGYWARFAATGDPNGAGAPVWPVYSERDDTHMEFGATIAAGAGLRAKEFDVLSQVIAARVGVWEKGVTAAGGMR